MMSEKQKRNIQRVKEAMGEIGATSSYEAWRIADIVLESYKIGRERPGDKEYKEQLDLLINPVS